MRYNALKYLDVNEKPVEVWDEMVVEKPLRILINGEPFTMTLRMPGHEKELAIGLLFAEDIIKNIQAVQFKTDLTVDFIDEIALTIDEKELKTGYLNSRNFLSVSSCGMCGKTSLPDLSKKINSNQNTRALVSLENMFDEMRKHQIFFEKTGGSHAAAAFDENGVLLSCMEDIGRHNAVDKVIGSLILENNLPKATYLIVSGRVSYEIIVKTFRAKIPVLAAVSSPSSLAIDYAKELGIRLIGFSRGKKFTIYS